MTNQEESSHSGSGSRASESPDSEKNATTESPLRSSFAVRGRGYESVKGLNSKMFEEARIMSVDPLDCISVKELRSRPLCRWGVQMIKDIILGGRDGHQRSEAQSFIQGFVSTGKYSVLVEIPVERSELIVQHFIDEDKTEEEARGLAKSKTWFLIVDGAHIHQALVELIHDFSENFAGFRWPVVVLSWQSDQVHQSIARACNEMQKEGHYIDFPLPDAMQSLRNVIEEHSKKTGVALVPGAKVRNGFIKEVMEIYSGGAGYSSSTLRCLCGIVLKMSNSFVAALRTLLTEECDEYWTSLGSKRPFGRDTRVFKKLISSQSFKKAGLFLNYDRMTDEDRVNVIHRLRFIAREKESFKAFQPSKIETQSRCVLAATAEIAKFEDFLGDESWPTDMMNLKRNILQTTLLEGDVNEHVASGNQLLPTIVSAYVKATGAHGSQKIDQFRRRLEMDEGEHPLQGDEQVVGTSACRQSRRISVNSDVLDSNEAGELQVGQELQGTVADNDDTSGEAENSRDPNVVLNKCGIEFHSTNLLEFEKHHTYVGLEFDFVIADPYQKVPEETEGGGVDLSSELVDEKGITLFVQCIRRLLGHGGFCFIFLDWDKLRQWTTCCKESQFEIVCEPFLIMKDPERVQKMNTKGLQNIYEAALVVRKPSTLPVKFEIQKTAPYLHLPGCRMPRWCNVIDGVPPPAQRLTFKPSRAQVRPGERPCALYIEIFKTFCPEKGSILDPIAGALTTGMAAIATDRSSVLLETDDRCLFHAVPRLRDFASAKVAEMDAIDLLSLGTGLNAERIAETNEEADDNQGSEEEAITSCENADRASDEDTEPSVQNRGSPCSIADHPTASYQSPKKQTPSRSQSSLQVTSAVRCSADQDLGRDRGFRSSEKSYRTSDTSCFLAAKRNRTIRSPFGPKKTRVEAQPGTPSSYRRSKRTRRQVSRFDS